MLEPVVARFRERDLRRYFRADAAFANPEVYEFLDISVGNASVVSMIIDCHGSGSVGDRYGQQAVSILKDAIDRIEFVVDIPKWER